ncbi:hypothetical protein [Chryseobacterium sp. MMS23-Vi53]|uniref:hypothetical protein n=1 Tax=Chryseobacterium sp. MMS23-Vi53 TaxID=3386644 RepID=UPI0039E8EE89
MRTSLFLLLLVAITAQAQDKKSISHTIYATGNLGYGKDNGEVISMLGKLSQSSKNTTVLFLGNNVQPSGFDKNNNESLERLDHQLSFLKNFNGNIFFIPESTEWKKGVNGIKQEQDFISKNLGNNKVFLPKDGCPVKKITIDNTIDLLMIDSEWALMNWDQFPNINDECDIKNKTAFYNEVESEIVKSQNKTVLIALCHPPASYGKYNNFFSFGINPQQINNNIIKNLVIN